MQKKKNCCNDFSSIAFSQQKNDQKSFADKFIVLNILNIPHFIFQLKIVAVRREIIIIEKLMFTS